MLFPGHTRLPPTMSGSFKYFLDYFWSELAGRQTFAYIVLCEKDMTVMDQMLTAALFQALAINGTMLSPFM